MRQIERINKVPEGKKFRDSLIPVLEWVSIKYGENLVKNTCCKNKGIR